MPFNGSRTPAGGPKYNGQTVDVAEWMAIPDPNVPVVTAQTATTVAADHQPGSHRRLS